MSPIPSSKAPKDSFLDHSIFGTATHKQVYTYLTISFLFLLFLITTRLLNEFRHTYEPIPSPSSLQQESRFTERTALLLETKRLKLVQLEMETARQLTGAVQQQQQRRRSFVSAVGAGGGSMVGLKIGVNDRSDSWQSGDTLVDDGPGSIAGLKREGIIKTVKRVVRVNANGERVNGIGNPIGNGLEFVGVEDGDVKGLINNGEAFLLHGVDEIRMQ